VAASHIDDAAAASQPHRRHCGLAAVPDPLDVHRHRSVPISLGDRIKVTALERAEKRGVVDQCVDAPKHIERCARHVLS
jgi:hypothetical protein